MSNISLLLLCALSLLFSKESAYAEFVRMTKMRKEFNRFFFHFGQLPVVLGFDTIPFMSPSVFDVWNKADSTR